MKKAILFLFPLLIFGCDSNDNKPEKSEYILHHRVLTYDIYLKLGGGEYTVRIMGYGDFTGKYTMDQWGNYVLDGTGCDGIEGVYTLHTRMNKDAKKALLTAYDWCDRYYFLSGNYDIVDELPDQPTLPKTQNQTYSTLWNR